MNLKVFLMYMRKAREHNWIPTIQGLKYFNLQVQKGLRVAPLYEWKNEKRAN